MRFVWGMVMCFFLSTSFGQDTLVQTESIALAPPVISTDSILFVSSTIVVAQHPMQEAKVTCSVSGLENDIRLPADQRIFTEKPLNVACSASHPDFKDSEVAMLSVRKVNPDISWMVSEESTPPAEKYAAGGFQLLSDRASPQLDYGIHWLGFNQPMVELVFDFSAPTYCHQVSLSTLINHRAWIFEPSQIQVFEGEEPLATLEIPVAEASTTAALRFYDLLFEPRLVRSLSIRIQTNSSLPAWHPGKGGQGWFFVDEVLFE